MKQQISVIIPVYNVEKYLRQCLDSAVGQTYENLEIIVVDDGSTDGSGAICDEYTKEERVKVYHTENRGLSVARNLGINVSHGNYLCFVDSDDWIDSDLIKKAAENIEDADILCFQRNEGTYTGNEALCEFINNRISATVWRKLYHKKCFEHITFPDGRIAEDRAIQYRLLHNALKVKCSSTPGYHYTIRDDSITRTHNIKNIIDYHLAVKEQYDYCIMLFQI